MDENLAGGLPRFLAQMAIMQPIEAEVRSTAALEVFGGGEPAYADGDKKDRISGMLFIARDVFAPEGRKASKWIGCEEFRQFADEYANNDACLGFGDENGMTLETPFGANSALIRFRTDQPHPQLGSGLLVNILICSYESFDAACAEAAGLNYMEAIRWTDVPQLGSWYPDVTRGEEAHLAHSCFIPNALFGPGLVVNLALWSIARVQWLRRTRYPELEDKTMTEILSSRLGLYG